MATIQLTKRIEVTNGNIFDCIGRDNNFSPVLYFKKNDDRAKIIDALTCYFDNETKHLVLISQYMSEGEFEKVSAKIQEKAEAKAVEFLSTVTHELNGYMFSWLPKQ